MVKITGAKQEQHRIEIPEIMSDFQDYWGETDHQPPLVSPGKSQDKSFELLGIMGQKDQREDRSFTESVKEVNGLLEHIRNQSRYRKCHLIAFPNGMIEGVDYTKSNMMNVIDRIDELYEKYCKKKILAIGIDFDGEFDDPPGLKSGITMVYVRTPDDRFAFYQSKVKPDPCDNPIEPFWRMNRRLRLKSGEKIISVLFLSCGEIFDDRFQTEFHDADVVINLAHRSARGFTKKAFKKRIKETLRDPRSGLGFMTFNQVKHPSHEGSYTIATKQPRVESIQFGNFVFRAERFQLEGTSPGFASK